jgi:hypothetical protein
MFKGVSQYIPAVDMLYFDLLTPSITFPYLFTSHLPTPCSAPFLKQNPKSQMHCTKDPNLPYYHLLQTKISQESE